MSYLISLSSKAQVPDHEQRNYVKILPTDSKNEIIRTAANIKPGTRQITDIMDKH